MHAPDVTPLTTLALATVVGPLIEKPEPKEIVPDSLAMVMPPPEPVSVSSRRPPTTSKPSSDSQSFSR